MMMRRRIGILLLLIFSLVGCGINPSDATIPEDVSNTIEEVTEEATDEVAEEVKEALDIKHELRFDEDGEFRILLIGDVQWGTDYDRCSGYDEQFQAMLQNIETLVERENPDLVLFAGDNTDEVSTLEDLKTLWDDVIEPIESRQIPWAFCNGNHDGEPGNVSREDQQAFFESYEHCVAKTGNEDLHGVGNYVLPVLRSDSDTIAFNIWTLDSGMVKVVKFPEWHSECDYIHFDQIMWYYQTSELLEEYNGAKIPAMMLFHIPLYEGYTAWEYKDLLGYEGRGNADATPAQYNSGLFAALLDRGDVKLIANGHIHSNDYAIEYEGVTFCHCGVPGESPIRSSHPDAIGARVIVVNQDDAENLETYMSYITDYNFEGIFQ